MLHERIGAGTQRAAVALAERGQPAALELERVACCSLSDFAEGVIRRHEDCVAGVLVRFDGPLYGTALFALDPEEALAWARATDGAADPVATYVELAGALLGDLVAAVSENLGVPARVGPARLEEDAVAAILLATHAPSDTAIVSAATILAGEDFAVAPDVYWLVEPKTLCSVLSALTPAPA